MCQFRWMTITLHYCLKMLEIDCEILYFAFNILKNKFQLLHHHRWKKCPHTASFIIITQRIFLGVQVMETCKLALGD